jgi:hypothetical protein
VLIRQAVRIMVQRAVGDLPREHEPWDVPGHRRLAIPLLKGPLPLAALVHAATRAGGRRENVYRAVRRLRTAGILGPPEHVQGSIRLAPGQDKRLRAAISAHQGLHQVSHPSVALGRTDAVGQAERTTGLLRHGDVVLGVHVDRDLMTAFASALEHVAKANRSLWGSVVHGGDIDYLLVADTRDSDVMAIASQLESAGARCRRLQVSAPMGADALVAHSRRLRNAQAFESGSDV